MATKRWVWAVGLVLLGGVPSVAVAQAPGGPGNVGSGTYGAPAGMLANPYANPYLNPFLNPYLMAQPGASVSPGNALMYMMAAQQMNGGIGSGRISGARRGPAQSAAAAPAQPTRARGVPSGRTARYFNRSYARGDLGRYYGRQDSYFPRTR